MTTNVEEKEIEEEFKKRNKDELKIVDSLNSLNEKVLNNYYSELKYIKKTNCVFMNCLKFFLIQWRQVKPKKKIISNP